MNTAIKNMPGFASEYASSKYYSQYIQTFTSYVLDANIRNAIDILIAHNYKNL